MAAPRRDTRGIVDAPGLFSHVDFRRREPAPPLRRYLEHYWLIDWDLPEPYASHVVPHPSVNIVFQRCAEQRPFGEVAGVGLGLFSKRLEGRGRVCGVQFRPGGFRPFAPARPVSHWTGRQLPLAEVLAGRTDAPSGGPDPATAILAPGGPDDPAGTNNPDDPAGNPDDPAGTSNPAGQDHGGRAGDDARVAALDAFLLALDPRPDPSADLATALAEEIRTDRTIRRVDAFAAAHGLSVRALQRLFAGYVGVGPKWIILRYRIHEALERAETERAVDWSALAADLGYADQSHLVRDFTTTVGVPPTAYARH